ASTPSRTRAMLFTTLLLRSARTTSSASASLSSTSKISTASNSVTRLSHGKREREYRALIHFAFRPYAAAVPGHDPMDDRQADSGSRELVGPVQPLEYPEQLLRVFHIEADAVIAHGVAALVADALAADPDAGLVRLARVLDRVGDEIRPHLAQQAAVA